MNKHIIGIIIKIKGILGIIFIKIGIHPGIILIIKEVVIMIIEIIKIEIIIHIIKIEIVMHIIGQAYLHQNPKIMHPLQR
jgi:hypothetical protein